MHRNVTAIYRTYATAELVRRELTDFGISSGDVHVIPDRDEPVGDDGHRNDDQYTDKLHDLHLPDDDLKTYQQSVRRGDYIVSAEADENQITRVQEIMRRPEDEAHDFDKRSGDFREETLAPHSDPNSRKIDNDRVAKRDSDQADPYTRSYTRSERLDERR